MSPALLALILKGLGIATTLWENRDLALAAINAIKDIINRKNVTQADIDAVEADLDALLEEFNAPLPPPRTA